MKTGTGIRKGEDQKAIFMAFGFPLLIAGFLAASSHPVWAANQQYGFLVNYASLPALVNDRKITLNVSVGNCASVNVTADGSGIASTYNSGTGIASFTTTGVTLIVTAVNWTSGGTGVASPATLYNNFKWAYSLTFDDGIQMTYLNAKPLLDAKGWNAGSAVITSLVDAGNPWCMSWTTIKSLQTAGWSIYNHSWDHPSLTCSNVVTQLGQAQADFAVQFPSYHVSHVVYPFEATSVANPMPSSCGATIYPPNFVLSGEGGGSGVLNYVDVFPLPDNFTANRSGLFGTDPTAWNNLALSADGNARPTWDISITHSVPAGNTAPPDAYSTNASTLGAHLDYLYNNFGAGGTNRMWFAPSGEVFDYLFTRTNVTVSSFSPGTPTFTPTGTLPTATFTPTKTPTSPATSTPTPTAVPCVLMNYDGETASTNLGSGSAWAQPAGSAVSETTTTPYAGSHCLQYNFVWGSGWWSGGGWNWAGYSAGKAININADTGIQIYLRSGAGTLNNLTLLLTDSSGVTSATVSVNSYLPSGVTTSWQSVNIPLSAFAFPGGFNQSSVWELDISTGGAVSGSQTLYLDNFSFLQPCGGSTATPTFTPTSTSTSSSPTASATPTLPPGCPSGINVTQGVAVNSSTCDQVDWTDSTGNRRSIWLVQPAGAPSPAVLGGYITRMSWVAGGTTVTSNDDGIFDNLSGWGQLVNHTSDGVTWACSKSEGYNGTKTFILNGTNQVILRYTFKMYADPRIRTAAGSFACTVDYILRNGRDDIGWAITYDSSASPSGTFTNDTRSPYCDFDWAGSGAVTSITSGINMGADYKFITTTEPMNNGPNIAYTFNTKAAVPVPYCGMYNDATAAPNDREIGYIQTESYAQHPGGAGWFYPPSAGASLPASWNFLYQMNAYQNFQGQRTTWMMPVSIFQTSYQDYRGTSTYNGYPYQCYTLQLALDLHSHNDVQRLLTEQETIHGGASLTASVGTIPASGPKGPGAVTLTKAWAPAGYDPVWDQWTVTCATNAADVTLSLPSGSLLKPAFAFKNFTAGSVPTITLNGTTLNAGCDFLATLDAANTTLDVTFNSTLSGTSHIVVGTSLTPTPSNTPTKTFTPAATNTATFTFTPSNSSTFTPSFTYTLTSTFTNTATKTFTGTSTQTSTSTFTFSPTNTPSFTVTNSPTITPTGTLTPSNTPTITHTPTNTGTSTYTSTFTMTSTNSFTNTSTSTHTTTSTPTNTLSPTSTSAPTNTFTGTLSPTVTPTNTSTSTYTPTASATSTYTSTNTFTSTASFTSTQTFTPSFTPTNTPVNTVTSTYTFSATATPKGASTLIVYPNPADGTNPVNVLPPAYLGFTNVKIQLFTTAFRLIQEKTYSAVPSGTSCQLELRDKWNASLSNGIYYVVVTTVGKHSAGKLLILK